MLKVVFKSTVTVCIVSLLLPTIPLHAQTNICPTLFRTLSAGMVGDDVAYVQSFLEKEGFFIYPEITNYFGTTTEEAVRDFQIAHEIVPIPEEYGVVESITSAKIDEICNASEKYAPTLPDFYRPLSVGYFGTDVFYLQQILKRLNLFQYPTITGYFGPITQEAVRQFQLAYDIHPPVGFFGPLTIGNISQFIIGTPGHSFFNTTDGEEVPDAPTTISVDRGINYLSLSWEAVDGATSYIIKRQGEDEDVYTILASEIKENSYKDSTVTRREYYSYIIIAVNSAGESNPSVAVEARTRSSGGGGGSSDNSESEEETEEELAVSLTSPSGGATVSGTSVNFTASVTGSDIVGVRFAVDGVSIGTEDTSAPYTATWNSTVATLGSHSITATVRDDEENYATSSAATVTVSNSDSVALIPMGDSRTSILHFDVNHRQGANTNPFFWANAKNDQAFFLTGNFGVSADTTEDMEDRIATALASKEGGYTNFITIWGGVNDIGTLLDSGPGSSGHYQSIADRVTGMATDAIAEGVRPIIFTDSGSEAWDASQVSRLLDLNDALTTWVTNNQTGDYPPILFDTTDIVWESPAVSSITFNSGYAYDGIHMNIPGSEALGAGLYNKITEYITPVPEEPVGTELLTNADYASTTGGIAGTGVTGTVPLSWRTSRDNSNVDSITLSINGDKARFVASSNGSNTLNGFRFRQDPSIAGLAGGDVLEGWGTIDIISGAENLGDCSVNLSLNYSDASFDLHFDSRTTNNRGSITSDGDQTLRLRTPRATVNPSKTLSSINYYFACRLLDSASVTVDMYEGTLRKIN